ncbi:hypothetical protein PAGA_a0495 [Pseudoalteromonas agarivorans DSM 14585]|uniref:Uncharacterized protein n=1 Tax=Pseudoalteromonas agarivorans DSM 14585 TaxID=1312369 RepID=A0ACA8DSY9_9GAMM|nr:hypothetical protein PAGA_a0495 [Pseudoalteromonas agarivorans DSM 14585]
MCTHFAGFGYFHYCYHWVYITLLELKNIFVAGAYLVIGPIFLSAIKLLLLHHKLCLNCCLPLLLTLHYKS